MKTIPAPLTRPDSCKRRGRQLEGRARVSDRQAWLEEWCPQCRAAPGARCRESRWGRSGTRAIWQATNQTSGLGAQHSGRGSARRVRQFRICADVFANLAMGEAVIYTTLVPDPTRVRIVPVALPPAEPERIGRAQHPCETLVHPELILRAAGPSSHRQPPAGGGPSTP
jgi:hypothetical protein